MSAEGRLSSRVAKEKGSAEFPVFGNPAAFLEGRNAEFERQRCPATNPFNRSGAGNSALPDSSRASLTLILAEQGTCDHARSGEKERAETGVAGRDVEEKNRPILRP
jgi:hypothetical protein